MVPMLQCYQWIIFFVNTPWRQIFFNYLHWYNFFTRLFTVCANFSFRLVILYIILYWPSPLSHWVLHCQKLTLNRIPISIGSVRLLFQDRLIHSFFSSQNSHRINKYASYRFVSIILNSDCPIIFHFLKHFLV